MPGCWCWRRSSAGSAWPSGLARCIEDPRAPERVRHGLAEMIRFRALLIAAGYADANDCDALRTDPAFKMAVGRLPESGADLCSQPTMCRLENLPRPTALKRMMAAMVELFCDSFERGAAPDRARHRRHRGPGARRPAARLFHAHYDSRCFLPIHIYEATTGKPVAVILRPGKTPDGRRGGAGPAPRRARHPQPLAGRRHPGPRRQPLQPARGDGLAGAQPRRLHLRPRRQPGPARQGRRLAEDAAVGRIAARPPRSAATASSAMPPRPGTSSGR